MPILTSLDAYAISRALIGQEWRELHISPWVGLILGNLGGQRPDRKLLTQILGPDLVAQVFAIDPNAPPSTQAKEDETVVIPPLPKEAICTHQPHIGDWLDEFLRWAAKRSPMTPPRFLEAGGIWALGLAIARRCFLKLHSPVYPHLYILWIAPTSIYKKTTGMEAIMDMVFAAMPHMLLPEESTPEAFIGALSGKKPQNYDDLSPYERKIDDMGRMYAAQRGILLDEASALFGAAKRDYMQGLMEMLLRLYDAPTRYSRSVRSEGKIIIRDASLSILGATTPAALAHSASSETWETGEMARYALLYPEQQMEYNLGNTTLDEFVPPRQLVRRLAALHQALPKPPDDLKLLEDTDEPPSRQAISCTITKDAYAAYAAYAKAVTYDMLQGDSLDLRLHPNYARLHMQAVKVAISLAAIDWADAGAKDRPVVTLDHWAKAQQVAETWRESLHNLIFALARSEDAITETRVLEHLLRYSDGETSRELVQRLRLSRKAIQGALQSLNESGLVAIESRQGVRGPAATVYKAV